MEYEKPQYSMSFDDDQGQVVNAASADLNELTKKVLHSLNPAPVIDDLPDSFVKLPAGLIVDGKVVNEAEVRELNGEHEEKIAKSRSSNNPAKYLSTLLLCGTVSIGDKPATSSVLDKLLQGDLDMLMLGIRRATFGDKFEVFNVECDNCHELNDLEMDLKDIPIQSLDDPEIREFQVPLRKGGYAKIQFPDGAVQNEIYKTEMTIPEMNSLTLSTCLISIVGENGNEVLSTGLSTVKKMGVKDRDTLAKFIYNEQPGPRYDKVYAKCHSCEGEVRVPLNVGILFREL